MVGGNQNRYEHMKCLVTGGAGFIGSHLVDRLITDGHHVIVIDNFSTGREENLTHIIHIIRSQKIISHTKNSYSEKMFEILIKSQRLKVIEADVTTPVTKIQKYFNQVDWVFHLAALADIVPSIEKPLAYTQTNVDGTVNVLEASRMANVKRFIYAASSSCYGIPALYPTPETTLLHPQYPYALTKYIGEQFVLHWGKIYKLPVISLRLFNVYGPRSRTSGTYGAVFGTFLAQKIHQKPFTVVGDGSQSRDFTFVTDVVNAFILAAQSSLTNEVFNVGTGKTQTINYLVKLLGGKVTYIPKRPGEPDKTQADIRKIKRMLGWKPQVSFAEGVKIMLNNIDYWKSAPVWTPTQIDKATKKWFKYLI